MQICSAAIKFALEDRYLIKSCERANVMKIHACVRSFLKKRYGTLIGLKTLIKETANSSTSKWPTVDACKRPTCTSVADPTW